MHTIAQVAAFAIGERTETEQHAEHLESLNHHSSEAEPVAQECTAFFYTHQTACVFLSSHFSIQSLFEHFTSNCGPLIELHSLLPRSSGC
ncbi:hypothetical protein Q31a_59400 [Aureliella helgolandensis]|uniref:Uncharacterized protein n=1 Tax=Aureliella helgolandensis TaxID=2527968 RepID=A0A518GG22_9BACT|nr:hypothetical protein Q31a_59400 [Aureliella helgolandensis]